MISVDLDSSDMVDLKDRIALAPSPLLPQYISWKLDHFGGLMDLNLIKEDLMGKLDIVYFERWWKGTLVNIVEW